MKIDRVDLYHLAIPFRFVLPQWSNNIVLRLMLEDGTIGFGECQALDDKSILDAFDPACLAPLHFDDPEDFTTFMRAGAIAIDGNALRCLIELALVDAYGRAFGLTVYEIFNRPAGPYCPYGGVTDSATLDVARLFDAGFTRLKLKLDSSGADRDALRACRAVFGPEVRVGIGTTAIWTADQAIAAIRGWTPFGIDYVEQPVPRDDHAGLARVAAQAGADIILDETVCSLQEARDAIHQHLGHGINVRLSKVGGFVPALAISDLVQRHGLRHHIGASMGETGILAAAGRHLAAMTAPRTLEGSYGDLLLKEDVTVPSVRFGHGGIGEPIEGPGLGITVARERIDRHKIEQRTFVL
ncbi:MAG TPA: mandelate racemase/muconate lactonizing enzyme family protein [Rhodopila sp.]|uniref:mandelate racemase/muconate lactonizing enzyme family protein n=1 Tax=Rhodopila sp. TaxID=2480087 RepID=UPI002CEDFCFB|nr:mandelate racemase/muconate lactonizing enzyme family protein [Rhodopila sp.]HVY14053.1 mandelate racemase/muconate lactonizing enzyme family protein [Rhodopila sp.]